MKSKLLILVMLILNILAPLTFLYSEPENVLYSNWLRNPVAVDGDVTFSNEWSDANKIELTLGTNYGRSPPFQAVTLWAKNDADNLYLLYCIKTDFIDYDLGDTAYIYYLMPDPVSRYIFSDKSETEQLGSTLYLTDYDGSSWLNDVSLSGENNVEGMGHFDGVFYWFELKKPLNSGDGHDWIFLYDEVYGFADSPIDKEEHLCVGMHDNSEGYDLQAFIQLAISGPDLNQIQSVGGIVEDIQRFLVLVSVITRLFGYITIIGLGAWLYIRRH